MQTNTQSRQQTTFDGIPTGEKERGGAGGVSKLDLRTHTDHTGKFEDWGITEFGSGRGKAGSFTDYGDGLIDITLRSVEDGNRKPKKPKKTSKPRAKNRSEMTDEDIERSLRRTRKELRQIALMLCPDKMLTFTTREPIVEKEVFKAITARFFRLCRSEGCSFDYVAVPERHMSDKTSDKKYGSLHLHLATKGKINYSQIRRIWREAVQWKLKDGDFEGANFNCSSRTRPDGKSSYYTRASIARYLSKYLTKDIDDEYFQPGKKRYWKSKGIAKPKKTTFFVAPSLHTETYRTMFEDILGLSIVKFFMPDMKPGQPPIIWMQTG